jgi:hypothetical protein
MCSLHLILDQVLFLGPSPSERSHVRILLGLSMHTLALSSADYWPVLQLRGNSDHISNVGIWVFLPILALWFAYA